MLRLPLLLTTLAFACTGCSDDVSPSPSQPRGAGGATAADASTEDADAQRVSGVVTRSVEPDLGGDAIGTLYLYLGATCATDSGGVQEAVATLTIPDADLSAEGASVPFSFVGVPEGTYQLTGFLDDVPFEGAGEPYPGEGDLVYFGSIAPKCLEVTVEAGDVDGLTLDLNFVQPFDLPGADAGTNIPDAAAPDVVDDGSTHAIDAVMTRSVAPGMGGDGRGPAYIYLSTECMSSTGDSAPPVAFQVIADADLSAEGSSVPIRLEAIPNGVYQRNGFVDDVTNATEENPFPGKGDLVSFGGVGPKCVPVVVDGADASGIVLDLNMVMPFDLPGR